jgi:hypothetical protein
MLSETLHETRRICLLAVRCISVHSIERIVNQWEEDAR